MLFNPTDQQLNVRQRIPLYYTGVHEVAIVSQEAAAAVIYEVDREYGVEVDVTLAARGITWFIIQDGKNEIIREKVMGGDKGKDMGVRTTIEVTQF